MLLPIGNTVLPNTLFTSTAPEPKKPKREMNSSDHAARAKKPVLPPKNRSVARPKNRKQINSIIANTTLFVFKDAMVHTSHF